MNLEQIMQRISGKAVTYDEITELCGGDKEENMQILFRAIRTGRIKKRIIPQKKKRSRRKAPMKNKFTWVKGNEYNRLARVVKRFEHSIRNHEMLGAHMPEEWPPIEREYQLARTKLLRELKALTKSP